MKRWEYSGGWKALAVIVNQICSVVTVLSVAVCTFFLGRGGFGSLGNKDSFENTAFYQNEVEQQVYRCIRAASRESRFEKDGVYDPNLLVDIREYAEENVITNTYREDDTEDGLYYRLGDLIDWSWDTVAISNMMKITYEDGSVDYVFTNSVDTITSEEDTDTEGAAEAARDSGSIRYAEQLQAVEEAYAPAGYDSIIEYAKEKQLATEELRLLYDHLIYVISEIGNDFNAYNQNLELFSPDMTNMRYVVIPKSVNRLTEEDYARTTYTNIISLGGTGVKDPESLLKYLRSFGDYLIFDSSDMSYEAENMPLSLSDISTYLKDYPLSVDGEYIFAAAVDSKYMANDVLQEYKSKYEQIQPVRRTAVYGAVLGTLLYLLTFVYLTVVSGHGPNEEDKEIRLNPFDQVKTEVSAVILGIPGVVVLVAGISILAGTDSLIQLKALVFGGGTVFLLNLLFLTGYLSLVRRLKARTLWRNSILCSIMELLYSMIRNWKVTTKMVFTYAVFLLMNLILLCCGAFGFLMALILDFVVGILLFQQALQRQRILDVLEKISQGDLNAQIPLEGLGGDSLLLAEAVNHIGGGLSGAVEKSIRDERLKTDLITNVSHDIKTPLTSIINYVDLLKREDIQNERAKNYIAILEDKAQRLKHLTDDLVEASKISSGNIRLDFVRINFQELINQTNGEFSEKFEEKDLQLVVNMPKEPVVIEADGRRLWRIIENLYNNVAKYAMPRTRVYVDLTVVGHMVRFHIKNISEQPLNIDAGELTERFIRGDVARSTEGSGLGLSIAKNLTQLQKGSFDIYLDGDLFKVTIIFPEADPIVRKEEMDSPEQPETAEGDPEEKACNPEEGYL